MDSGLCRAATGVLGGLFQTPLYHLRPVGVPSRRIQDFLSINDGGVLLNRQIKRRHLRRPEAGRRKPESGGNVIPAKAGIQDVRRLARASLAETTHVWSFPFGGKACNQPLDSGLHWNDGEGNGGVAPAGMTEGDSGINVIPAKAGIQTCMDTGGRAASGTSG